MSGAASAAACGVAASAAKNSAGRAQARTIADPAPWPLRADGLEVV